MLRPYVRLVAQCPSPTTISYTVSNALPRVAPSAKAFHYLGILSRMFFSIVALSVCIFSVKDFVRNGKGASGLDLLGFASVKAINYRLVILGSLCIIWLSLRRSSVGGFTSTSSDSDL